MILDHVIIRDILNVSKFITKPIFFEEELFKKNISYCLHKGHLLIIGYKIDSIIGVIDYPYVSLEHIHLRNKLCYNIKKKALFYHIKKCLLKKNIPLDLIKIILKY